MARNITIIDCTLRDGGYYNNWDFSRELISEYLKAMVEAQVDYVELGFRSFDKNGFRGACAFSTDDFILSLPICSKTKIGVMMNASELLKYPSGVIEAASAQFCAKRDSPVSLVRIACHLHEFEYMLPVCEHLKDLGYTVGINLMQIADRSDKEIENIAKLADKWPIDVLYFADSLGSLEPTEAAFVVKLMKRHWNGDLGIHTHDSMGRAVTNTFSAVEAGANWIDATVTGMGRGPGNAQTEYVLLEAGRFTDNTINIKPLLTLIHRYFLPMRDKYRWGVNPYYYMAGQMGIHPTYVQEMLKDQRYGEAEILSVLEHLGDKGGKKFDIDILEKGQQYKGVKVTGSWAPEAIINERDVLILGAGNSVLEHQHAIEHLISKRNLFVIGLNTQRHISEELIALRAACHPFRLLAEFDEYKALLQPIVIPHSEINKKDSELISQVKSYDFGMRVQPNLFEFNPKFAVVPKPLVAAFALAIANSGKAKSIMMAGFDGFSTEDPRAIEMAEVISAYQSTENSIPLLSITPTKYNIPITSVYAF